MKNAFINIPADEFPPSTTFMILRAAHYLAEFRGISTLSLNIPEPVPDVRYIWESSLKRTKREIVFQYSVVMPEVPPFSAPGFPVSVNGKIINLNIPEIPGMTDFHEHTRLAYCSENMEVAMALELARLSGVQFVNFAEHSGQLYCSPETYWQNRFILSKRLFGENRTADYIRLTSDYAGIHHAFGLELDVDAENVVSEVSGVSGFRIGAVHFLGSELSYNGKKMDFMRRIDALLAAKIDILAHPFRVFRKAGAPIPEDLFEPLAEKLVKAGVAAEINFHTNRPQPEFVELMIRKGGRISFGSDAHNLYEAGYFLPHYEFCKELGIAGRLDEFLLSAFPPAPCTKYGVLRRPTRRENSGGV